MFRQRAVAKTSLPDATVPYVIIGDTLAALLYCFHLQQYFSSLTPPMFPKIYLLSEGPDLDDRRIERTARADYAVNNGRDMVAHLNATTIHLLPYDGNYFGNSSESRADVRIVIGDTQYEDNARESFTYYTGRGVVGDVIASYYNPRFGPYMRGPEGKNILNFVANKGVQASISAYEEKVTNSLINLFSLSPAKSDAANMAINNKVEYVFMSQLSNGELRRKLFTKKYDFLASSEAPNVSIFSGCNFSFTSADQESTTGIRTREINKSLVATENRPPFRYNAYEQLRLGTDENRYWDVDIGRGQPIIRSAKVIFKCNPYDQLRIAGRGNMEPRSQEIPVTYRTVLRFERLTEDTTAPDPDGLLAHVSFTLSKENIPTGSDSSTRIIPREKNSTGNEPISWIISAYTAYEDYADVGVRTNSGSEKNVLLIIEAISFLHTRRAEYDFENLGLVEVQLREPEIEDRYRLEFAEIVASVYLAFSGKTISLEKLLGVQQVCLDKGPCTEQELITSFPRRETPLNVIFNAANSSSNWGRR